MLAVGTSLRLPKAGAAKALDSAFGMDDVVDSAVGAEFALHRGVALECTVDTAAAGSAALAGSAVAAGAAVAVTGEAAARFGCSRRNFPSAVADRGFDAEVAAWAVAAGEGFDVAAGRLAGPAAAWRLVLVDVVSLAERCEAFEEPSSAHAIPHVVKIAAPTPSATASPPTRPMHPEALIVRATD